MPYTRTRRCDAGRDRRGGERGLTLTEVLVALVVLALATAVAVPTAGDLHRRAALTTMSQRLSAQLGRCRAFAVLNRCNTALVFDRRGGRWRCFVAADGDGDGVLRRDLASGEDRRVGDVVLLEGKGASLGILQGVDVPDPGGRGVLGGNLDDPIRAGRGDMVSFSEEGTASPSSLYLTDHQTRMRVLRTYGLTGRYRLLEWQQGWPAWKRVR